MSIQKWNQEDAQKMVEQWRESGLDKMAFCKEQGIVYSRFLYWNKRLNHTISRPDIKTGFVSLSIDPEASVESICLKGTNGLALYVSNSPASLQFIKSLLSC